MKMPYSTLYNYVLLPIVYLLFQIVGLFNKKIKSGIDGRRNLFSELEKVVKKFKVGKKIIWFHSSSLGEFEQAKPIIEKLKSEKDVYVVVTFFSPSGYQNSKKYSFADYVTYIPFDTKKNAERFVEILKPDVVLFMRYDIWPNHVYQIKKQGIKLFLVDATLRRKTIRNVPLFFNFHKKLYNQFDKILTISKDDYESFTNFEVDLNNIEIAGDTRFDRVHQRSVISGTKKLLREDIFTNRKIIVAGSTWHEDEEILLPVFNKIVEHHKNVILIIAPHEPTIEYIEKIEAECKINTIRFSALNNYNNEQIIIVDSIGILMTLYYYSYIAFVGGSFKSNVHNVLEAAVYGVPVFYGPKIFNSQEAVTLSKIGGGKIIHNKKTFYRNISELLRNENSQKKLGELSKKFVLENTGATEKILNEVYKWIK